MNYLRIIELCYVAVQAHLDGDEGFFKEALYHISMHSEIWDEYELLVFIRDVLSKQTCNN